MKTNRKSKAKQVFLIVQLCLSASPGIDMKPLDTPGYYKLAADRLLHQARNCKHAAQYFF